MALAVFADITEPGVLALLLPIIALSGCWGPSGDGVANGCITHFGLPGFVERWPAKPSLSTSVTGKG